MAETHLRPQLLVGDVHVGELWPLAQAVPPQLLQAGHCEVCCTPSTGQSSLSRTPQRRCRPRPERSAGAG